MVRLTIKLFIIFLFITAICYAAINYLDDVNCQGAWKMTSNDIENDLCSGGNEDLTESGGNIPSGSDCPAQYSNCTSRTFVDGDTEQLEAADGGATDISGANANITYCGWGKRSTDNEEDCLVCKYETVTGDRQYRLTVEDSGTGGYARCIISADGTFNAAQVAEVNGTTDWNTGEWHHACCVYNDTDLRLYVDGELEGTPDPFSNGIHDGASEFAVGGRTEINPGANGWDGQITEPIVFDRALGATEVKEIFDCGIDGTQAGTGCQVAAARRRSSVIIF